MEREIFTILPNGNLSILGVCVGMDVLKARQTLKGYDYRVEHVYGQDKEIKTFFSIRGARYGRYTLNMAVHHNDEFITNICARIGSHSIDPKKMILDFESLLSKSFEKIDGEKPIYQNTLLNIRRILTYKDGYHLYVSMRIRQDKKIDLSGSEVSQLYTGDIIKTKPRPIEKLNGFKMRQFVKLIVAAIAISITYLFALNGRYIEYNGFIYDKWKREIWNFNIEDGHGWLKLPDKHFEIDK